MDKKSEFIKGTVSRSRRDNARVEVQEFILIAFGRLGEKARRANVTDESEEEHYMKVGSVLRSFAADFSIPISESGAEAAPRWNSHRNTRTVYAIESKAKFRSFVKDAVTMIEELFAERDAFKNNGGDYDAISGTGFQTQMGLFLDRMASDHALAALEIGREMERDADVKGRRPGLERAINYKVGKTFSLRQRDFLAAMEEYIYSSEYPEVLKEKLIGMLKMDRLAFFLRRGSLPDGYKQVQIHRDTFLGAPKPAGRTAI